MDFAGNRISFSATVGETTRLEVFRQLAATGKRIRNPRPLTSEAVE